MIATFLLAAGLIVAADGTLLSREPATLGDDTPADARQQIEGVTLESIVYSSDGLEIDGFLLTPDDAQGRLPCIVYCRGGNRDFGALNPLRAARILGAFAQHGYVVVASNYRGNGVHGLDRYPGERECPEGDVIGGLGREEFGGADVRDVLALIPLLESLSQADASRIGIFGWSRGGMMTYCALRGTDRFKAAVVGGALSDMHDLGDERPEMIEHVYAELIPGWEDPELRTAALNARSAITFVDELPDTTPILIVHGTADWRVSPEQPIAMAAAMLEARKPYRLILFEGADHGIREQRAEVERQALAWFDRFLRDGEALPDLEPHGP